MDSEAMYLSAVLASIENMVTITRDAQRIRRENCEQWQGFNDNRIWSRDTGKDNKTVWAHSRQKGFFMDENFYQAAIRHYVDGMILLQEECFDNAVGLFGNSAECALKSLVEVYCGENSKQILKYGYSHEGKTLINDLCYFITNSNDISVLLLDPALALKLQGFVMPVSLFQNHPERRYAKDGEFHFQDAEDCKYAVGFLMREMIIQRIDGYL